MDQAAGMIEKAILANPTYAEAYNNLGTLFCCEFQVHLVEVTLHQCSVKVA